MQDKLQLLALHCQKEKPSHRKVINVNIGDQPYRFKPGKLLDQIKPFLVDKNGRRKESLPTEFQDLLHKLPWFEQWLSELGEKRKTARAEPPFQEQFHMLVYTFIDKPPKRGVTTSVERINECDEYILNGCQVLDKAAVNFFGDEHGNIIPEDHPHHIPQYLRDAFLRLNWSREWVERGMKFREVAKMRKIINKEMKIEVLLNLYSRQKPKWKDCVNIVYDNSSKPFKFYIGTWLDDLVENWDVPTTCSNDEVSKPRPSVVLDEAQKLVIEQLPWFKDWFHGIVKNRQIRPLKKLMFEEDEDTEDEGEEEQTQESQESHETQISCELSEECESE